MFSLQTTVPCLCHSQNDLNTFCWRSGMKICTAVHIANRTTRKRQPIAIAVLVAESARPKSDPPVIHGRNVMSAQMLEASLLLIGVGTVLSLESDACSMAK